ncbi:MAG TPA: YhjD/YihY/BrkB family envelope integrity protein [Anaeromyxobacteraceae bacterium]|nr:YhjD/YihY/BrkB family envelope integrity protein [Anaeromyxobacteraceae bacterium]
MKAGGLLERTRRGLPTARLLARALNGGDLRSRAMALTYLSLFAVVPALVLVFSVLQAFTGMEALWRPVHAFLLDNLAVGARAAIEPQLDRFLKNAHATSAGLVGGALLVVSTASLFAHVERALNAVWAVRRPRSIAARALVYWAILTLAPLLLAGSLALGRVFGGFLAGVPVGQLLARAAAVLLSCLLFLALYLFVPATRVRFVPAAVGALAAGVSFEIAKALYTFGLTRFVRYSAIYGSVAAVPIFLLWLYVSWTLVLYGARVSFVVQHARALLRGRAPEAEGTPVARELLAARAMLEVALAYRDGAAPPDPGEVAYRVETFGEAVREILGTLRARGLVLEVLGGGLVPARPLREITLSDVRRAVAGEARTAPGGSSERIVADLLGKGEAAALEALAREDYEVLCARVRKGEAAGVAEGPS